MLSFKLKTKYPSLPLTLKRGGEKLDTEYKKAARVGQLLSGIFCHSIQNA